MYNVKDFAPIALFVYRRLDCARQAVASLLKNAEAKDSLLYVFSDGPRTGADTAKVRAVRDYVRTISGFKEVRIIEALANKGLAASIMEGVTKVVNEHGKVIVVEDDLVVSRYFLEYMNLGLTRYAQDSRVISISGYMYPVRRKSPTCFFRRSADCWGWATWKRGWALFERDGGKLLSRIKNSGQARAFDLDGAYPYMKMLEGQAKGEVDSWAIRWLATAFLENRLTLYPPRSLVKNIGTGEGAAHSRATDPELMVEDPGDFRVTSVDVPVVHNKEMARSIHSFFWMARLNIFPRAFNKIRTLAKGMRK